MSRIEGEFVSLALDLGLAEAIAETLRDIDRAIGDYPKSGGRRYLVRLQDQRRSLVNPSLRTMAALVVSICSASPWRSARIAPVFARLVEQRPELGGLHERFRQGAAPASHDIDPSGVLERGAA